MSQEQDFELDLNELEQQIAMVRKLLFRQLAS